MGNLRAQEHCSLVLGSRVQDDIIVTFTVRQRGELFVVVLSPLGGLDELVCEFAGAHRTVLAAGPSNHTARFPNALTVCQV